MTPEKLMLLGCDDNFALSALLRNLKAVTTFSYQVISTPRITDLRERLTTLEPDLIILCFRNNQYALNDIHSVAGKPDIPLLCLSRAFGSYSLKWPATSPVFVLQLEHQNKCQYLVPMINSILRLRSAGPLRSEPPNSISEATVQNDKPDANRSFGKYIMQLDQKAGVLSKVRDGIADLSKRVDDSTREKLHTILNTIKTSSQTNKFWGDFMVYFEQTDPEFLWLVVQKFPNLSPIDIKYCCYIKMNMSNDDIGNLLSINKESVRTHKYRLKKKMSLAKGQDLRNYLRFVQVRQINHAAAV